MVTRKRVLLVVRKGLAELGLKGKVEWERRESTGGLKVSQLSVVNLYNTLLALGIYSPGQRMVCLQTSTSTHRCFLCDPCGWMGLVQLLATGVNSLTLEGSKHKQDTGVNQVASSTPPFQG